MKKIFALASVAIIGLSLTAFNVGPKKGLQIGDYLPNATLKMKSTTEKMISFNDIATPKGTLVIFSCNTCPYVLKSASRIKDVSNYALENGFGLIILNSNEDQRKSEDSYEAMQKFASTNGYNWNYVVDEKSVMADEFGATRTPEVYLFNGDRKLVYKGAIDDNQSDESAVKEHYLMDALRAVGDGTQVKVAETQSVGCKIKRVAKTEAELNAEKRAAKSSGK